MVLSLIVWIALAGCAQWPDDILQGKACDAADLSRHCTASDSLLQVNSERQMFSVQDDFESGKIMRPPWALEGRDPFVTAEVSLSGSFSCKSYLPAQLYENARSELRFHGLVDHGKANNYGRNFPFFTTWGIHFAVYVPTDFKPDPFPEIWAQFHGDPDPWDNILTPPLALVIEGYRIRVGIRYADEDPSTQTETVDFSDAGRVTPGAWHHFVIELNWDYRREGNGFCRVYLKNNGFPGTDDLIVDYSGPVGYNDARGPYLKLGIYKWSWSYPDRLQESLRAGITERLLYYDDIIVRDASIVHSK